VRLPEWLRLAVPAKAIPPLWPPWPRTTGGSGREEKESKALSFTEPAGYAEKAECIVSMIMRLPDPAHSPSGQEEMGMEINEITSRIINGAMAVHTTLGPGLLESVYQECLRIELESVGLRAEKEIPGTG